MNRLQKPRLLVVAAYDPSGGAGVLADCRAAASTGTPVSACLTALTIQSSRHLERVVPFSAALLDRQLRRLVGDDGPPGALKIGALTETSQIQILARFLKRYPVPAVYDPVAAPTRGIPFIPVSERRKFRKALAAHLYPCLSLITPNRLEYDWLFEGLSPEEISRDLPFALLLKGGHQKRAQESSTTGTVKDCLYQSGKLVFVHSRPHVNVDIHGTGCVLASLIASRLASRQDVVQAVRFAEKRMNHLIRKAAPTSPGAVATLFS